MSRVFVIGAGASGLATGRAARAAAHRVTFVDSDPGRRAELAGQGLDTQAGLTLRGEPESFVVVTLPTLRVSESTGRHTETAIGSGSRFDLSTLRDGIRVIGRALTGAQARHIIVIRSAVPPGTTDGMIRHLLERASGRRAGEGFDLVYLPGLRAGDQAGDGDDLAVLTVIGAVDHRVAQRTAREFAPFYSRRHLVGSATAAELIGLAHALQQTVNAAFWRDISRLADELEIDAGDVAQALGGHRGRDGRTSRCQAALGQALLHTATATGSPVPLLVAALAEFVEPDRDRPAGHLPPSSRPGTEHLLTRDPDDAQDSSDGPDVRDVVGAGTSNGRS